jgi:serine/threonine protein kinase
MPKQIFKTAFDDYVGGRRLGSGGTGYVIEATARGSQATVAIKVFDPQHRQHAAEKRFKNEMTFGQKAAHKTTWRCST